MELLARHGAEDLVAFGGAGDRTAAQLRSDAASLAALLPAPERDRYLLVVGEDRYHFAVALVAAVVAGHAIALPPNGQDQVIRTMAASRPVLALLHDRGESIGIDIRRSLGAPLSRGRASLRVDPDRELAVVHTSGTSGDASAHTKTAGQLIGEAQVLVEQFGIERGARLVATVPAHHIYGLLFSVLVPLVGGAAFHRGTPLHAEAVAAALRDQRAGILISVPAHLRTLRLLDRLSDLDLCFSSGAPLMPDVATELGERFGLRVTEVLGSTETGGLAWRHSDGDGRWTPLPGVELSTQSDGRLLVDSPFLGPAVARPYRSEDRGELFPDGRFEHRGRMDDVVKVAGKRVSLGDIERRLRALPGVDDAAVSATEVGGARGWEPIALVVAPGMSPQLLRSGLARSLDPVVIPRRMRLVDELPRDERGKLPLQRLLAAYEAAARPPTQVETLESIVQRDEDIEVCRVSLRPPRNLLWFRGHFSTFPLLPGVLQLELARTKACETWTDLEHLGRVLKLKFKRPIRPGEKFVLELRRKHQQPKIEFEFESGGGLASSGVLDFGPRKRA